MPSRILITGGSGFIGSAVIDELLARGYSVNAIHHRRPIVRRIASDRLKSISADLFDLDAVERAMSDCTAVIHLVGIIRQIPSRDITFQRLHVDATRIITQAAQHAGIHRYLHMSAIGAHAGAQSDYHRTKFAAEQIVRQSSLDWTIFQPALVHGPNGELTQMEADWARKKRLPYLFMPYFGAGLFGTRPPALVQPVYVSDVARAFVDAIDNPRTSHETYPIGGAERMTWRQMHVHFARALVHHRRWVMPIPAWYSLFLTRVVPASFLPFNRDQVIMSQQDGVCDLSEFAADFGWTPRSLDETLPEYAHRI